MRLHTALLRCALLVAAFVVLPAAPAFASSAAVVGEEVLVTGDDDADVITVELIDKTMLISDPGGITAGEGCEQTTPGVVSCKANQVLRAVVQSGAGDDRVRVFGIEAFVDGGAGNDKLRSAAQATLFGSDGDDKLRGGVGNDLLSGGDGEDRVVGDTGLDVLKGGRDDDFIDGQDGEKDRLNGGGGKDLAAVDPDDRIRKMEQLVA